MTKNRVEVITSVQRRRRWPISEKERIVAAALEPGAVACEVARAAGSHVSQLLRWRQQLCAPERTAPTFSPVAVVPRLDRTPELFFAEAKTILVFNRFPRRGFLAPHDIVRPVP